MRKRKERNIRKGKEYKERKGKEYKERKEKERVPGKHWIRICVARIYTTSISEKLVAVKNKDIIIFKEIT
jgi:hypothetical protein